MLVLVLLSLIGGTATGLDTAKEWVGHVEQGRARAEQVARELNLILLDEVIPDSNLFHFKASGLTKRSTDPVNIQSYVEALGVKQFEEQKPVKRVKRDNIEARELQGSTACYVSTIGTPDKPSRRCVFPFRYKGRHYQRCTTNHSNNNRSWCATSVHRDGSVIVGEWGDCDLDNRHCSVLPLPHSFTAASEFPDFPSDFAANFPELAKLQPEAVPASPRSRLPLRPHNENLENSVEELLEATRPQPPIRPPRPPPRAPARLPMGTRILPVGIDEFLLLLSNKPKKDFGRPRPSPILPKAALLDMDRLESRLDETTLDRFSDKNWGIQWYLNRGGGLDMNVEEAWDLGYTGKGVTVTILDDGVEWKHPDLMVNYAGEASFDINDNDRDPFPRYDLFDTNKHGTRCAGQVAAMANNSLCSVGIAYNAGIGGVRMLDGTITDAVEARSLSLNTQYIDIYSASWGPDDDGRTLDGPGPLTRRALEEGVRRGRQGLGSVFVWASGNGGKFQDNCNCDGYATSIYTLSVSSASENGLIPWYSEQCSSTLATTYSSGSSRQGERKVVTTDLHGRCTTSHTGTSASSPMAAGILALVLEANPKLTWRDLQHITVRTAKKANLKANDWRTNGAGYNVSHAFGFGLMDAGAMVKMALNWTTVPEQMVCEATWVGEVVMPASDEVAIRLPVGEECLGTLRVLEHVHVVVGMDYARGRRGDVAMELEAPSGLVSEILAPRPMDNSFAFGFNELKTWPLMSTHHWGENPQGNWTLKIRNYGLREGVIEEWQLILYGTAEPHNTSTSNN